MKCPYCHSDGSHLDNASIWGSKPIDNVSSPEYPALYIDLSTHRLVMANALEAWRIRHCPMCGRKLLEEKHD